MKMTEKEFNEVMEAKLAAIKTREDLAEFLHGLAAGYRAGFLEQQSVADYVGGAGSFVAALDGYCKNFDLECPDQPDWRWVGEIFDAAFEHS